MFIDSFRKVGGHSPGDKGAFAGEYAKLCRTPTLQAVVQLVQLTFSRSNGMEFSKTSLSRRTLTGLDSMSSDPIPTERTTKESIRHFLWQRKRGIVFCLSLMTLSCSAILVVIPYQREQRIAKSIEAAGGQVVLESFTPRWFPNPIRVMQLSIFNRVVVVDLDERSPSPELLQDVMKLRHNEFLRLYGQNVGDVELEQLKGQPSLTLLILDHTRVTDAGIEHLLELTTLRELDLSGANVTDAGMKQLFRLPKLQDLVLRETKISDRGLAVLAKLTSLRQLVLSQTRITDVGLKHLQGMTRLEALVLRQTQTTDAGLEQLHSLTALRAIDLGGTQISDAGLESLREMVRLQSMSLDGTHIRDAGMEQLRAMVNLIFLDLSSTQIGDAGLEPLKALTNLRQLNLENTQTTEEGRAVLRKALPNCVVLPTD